VGVDTDIETSGDTDISTTNTMRERADENWIKLWVILKANRLYIAGVLAFTVSFTLVGIGTLVGVAENLNSGDTKGAIFSTLLGAIITGTTLIVTISQLVIS
jgi:ABC-type siderophore export system fused ATPase/permease subunit